VKKCINRLPEPNNSCTNVNGVGIRYIVSRTRMGSKAMMSIMLVVNVVVKIVVRRIECRLSMRDSRHGYRWVCGRNIIQEVADVDRYGR